MSDEFSDITRLQSQLDAQVITTRKDLKGVFKKLGLKSGDAVMIHASLKRLGYLVNGPHDVIDAIEDCVGPSGTLLVSANSSQNTDPAQWKSPPVPSKWIKIIRKNMRSFDAKTTLIRGRGLLPLTFMLYPGVYRSTHPVKSIAARGRLARSMTSHHPFHETEGKGSPLHKLYVTKGKTLLIGVDLSSCSIIHVAEFLADVEYLKTPQFKCLVQGPKGSNRFISMNKNPIRSSKYFQKLYQPLKAKGILKELSLHDCPIQLLDVAPCVNYVVEQLKLDQQFLAKP